MAPPNQEWQGRGSGRGRGSRGSQPCRYFQQGTCRFGAKCSYSHDLGSTTPNEKHERRGETAEQLKSKADYNSWKRLIKNPPRANDTRTIGLLWTGALTILNGDDRDWKQMLPRDLDADENYGREHILTLLSMVVHSHGCVTFVDLVSTFGATLR